MAKNQGASRAMKRSRTILEEAVSSGRSALLEHESDELARAYNIPLVKAGLAKSEGEAMKIARGIGYPIVMKVVSPDILHKTDAGGVVVNIASRSEAKSAYRKIIKNARRANKDAEIVGIYVQKMAPKAHEFVIGATRDPQFGPTVMFGLGGIYVEIFKDVSFRLSPVSMSDALSMMQEVKASKLLNGFRGEKPLDKESAAKAIQSIGRMMDELPQISSIDVNPIFIYPRGVLAADMRIILSPPKENINHS